MPPGGEGEGDIEAEFERIFGKDVLAAARKKSRGLNFKPDGVTGYLAAL